MIGKLCIDGPLARRHRATLIEGGDHLVILSHGFGTDQTSWAGVLQRLQRRFSVLVYDLPGAGPLLPSDFSVERYRSLSAFADDLLHLLDEIGVQRASYVGHSVSGMIGVLAAIEDPLRFHKLLLLNSSPRYLDDTGYRGGFSRGELDSLLDAMALNYQSWVAGFAPLAIGNDSPHAIKEFSTSLLAMRPDIALRVARAIFQSDVRDLLPRLTVPTVLVHAREDVAVPEDVAHYLARHIPRSRLAWIPVTGHLPHLSAPDQVVDALRWHLGV
ncbi:MAG: alpha/beta fold hydrolase [Sphingomonas oligoaromativorans]